MKHIKLFEAFVNEDIKIRKSITEEKAIELLHFLKQAIGKKLNWKEFSKWHGGATQLGRKSPVQQKFLDKNFECEITDVRMRYDADSKYAQLAISFLHNAPWYAENDAVELKLYKDDTNWTPKDGDTKDHKLDLGAPARYHWEKQFDRFSDITRIGRFGI